MYKLKKGSLQTSVYNENDLNNYISAGWKLIEEPKTDIKVEKEEEIEKETKPIFEKPTFRTKSKYVK